MKYDFTITIERIVDKTPLGTKIAFKYDTDLEQIFTPYATAMILKEWAKTLEERMAIKACPQEEYRSKEEYGI